MKQPPVVKAQMLVRRPAGDLFEAFADPAITCRFWFSRGSDRLDVGKRVRWDWEMYGFSTWVEVKEIEPDRRILIAWSSGDRSTNVEWVFEPRGEKATLVTVRNWGFSGDGDAMVAEALDSAGGFSFVLAGLKAFLEHGIELKLIEDHSPEDLVQPSS